MRNYRPNKGAPRNATERHGTLRNLTGRLNLAIPHWDPPYFGGFPPNCLIFYAADAPFLPNTQTAKGAKCETTDQTKERLGTPRSATETDGSPKLGHTALGPAEFWWIFSKLPNIYCFLQPPLSPTRMWGRGEMRNYRPNKGAPRDATERYGTRMVARIRTFRTAARRILADFLQTAQYFMLPAPPFFSPTTPKWGKGGGGGCETTDQTKGRRGAPLHVTDPDGTPKFGQAALVSAIFW